MGMSSKEFDNQTGRFRVRYNVEWGNYELYDTLTNEVVGCDGGEPEDQTLVRDWQWVRTLLNKLAEELEVRK